MLAGRDHILERFDVTLSRMEDGRPDLAPFITGSRGSGKTVLLNQLAENARQRGWFVAAEEVIPRSTFSSLIAIMAHEILLEMSRRHRVAANVRRALGILKAFTAVSALGVTLQIDAEAVTGAADTGIFSRDLRRLFIEIGELARQQGVGVTFALDEVHVLSPRELDELNSALHQTAQRSLPVTFLGAGLFPSWQNSGVEQPDPASLSSYATRMDTVTYVRLDPLSHDEARQALVEPALAEQVTFADSALDDAIAFCSGNPWLIQLVGSTAWEIADSSSISGLDMQHATFRVWQQLYDWYFPRLLRSCSRHGQRLLRVIAKQLDGGTASFESMSEVQKLSGLSDVRHPLSELTRLDLIALDYSDLPIEDSDSFGVRFTVPLLSSYFHSAGRPVA
jgi:hypothetical protein